MYYFSATVPHSLWNTK